MSDTTRFYTLDVLAASGQTLALGTTRVTLTGVGAGPSINNHGAAAFVVRHSNGSGIMIASESGACHNVNPGYANSPLNSFSGAVQINDSDQIISQSRSPGAPPTTRIRTWNGHGIDQTQLVLTGGDRTFPFRARYDAVVAYPSINNTGDNVFAVLDDTQEKLATLGSVPDGTYDTLVPFPSRPQMSDDGRIIVRVAPDRLRLYDRNLAPISDIACQAGCTHSGFTRIGMAPGISDDGQIITFAGDRGNGPGVFASIDICG